ncbi:hypothetical protein acsn021_30830 [Anaerocolumna cellulosilytica]|uniref:Uncharacterized protein n=1 Tax=Anaerocolumna cellulosilytica TaxID=433286 RepID=A0A6S6QY02_9FIRM|nr:hypothetical protein [Anaerocolumna cellulosilytica]MBB5198172.1 hypothetical protein [Anaerocolumna cellulosilytica]BCJ95514.1 hypothetical protein acsn021_30830 [Anaerocolumna cellulosilytica]
MIGDNLPRGIGYKSSWLTIKAPIEQVLEVLFLKEVSDISFEEGLKVIRAYGNNSVLVWSYTTKDLTYLLGNSIEQLTYDENILHNLATAFKEVHLFFTHRVSEAHGFARLINGEIERAYFYDEDRIFSSGAITNTEKQLGINLPNDFDEMWENWNNEAFTKINEDVIISLAEQWTAIESTKEQYVNVKIGQMNIDFFKQR